MTSFPRNFHQGEKNLERENKMESFPLPPLEIVFPVFPSVENLVVKIDLELPYL